MKVIGLTGSIGMGKSTVASMFAALRVPVFDADAEVHRLQGPGGRALAMIEAAFPGTTGPDGLDRQALGKAVFGRPADLKRLEAIMHPMVAAAQSAFLARARRGRTSFVILDIPLLFEGSGWKHVDGIITVSAPARVQRARVLRRPGMTEARFLAIRAAQVPDRQKRARSDFIIETGRGKRVTLRAVRRLAACLSVHGVRYCRQCVKSSSTRKRRA
ncbi:dephospho-CoA kinase [Pacificimonas sp. WHA3]|uniref:Dephospho-CoA kinase n=1 Tax=Pacificimonas pallii TaxID=2827236 RepID=A0ABS6SD23_9SPHN|nr:dephospho-CoA kinase [Pacificimonas pallii]MBV7255752.1 dephospho-CoA kinase [Pacificimonas pallii]